MNSTTKKFLSAILTTAIVFTQAGTTVSAATNSSAWGTSTSATQTTQSTSKDFGNSKYWSEKDKYGYAYPYSYYYYASNPTAKKVYVQIYEALHDRKSTISVSDTTRKALKKSSNVSVPTLIKEIIFECPELYYADYDKCKSVGEGTNKKNVYYIDYLSEQIIASNEKTFAKVLKDFDAYLDKNNATTTKQFLSCATAYLGNTITYDKAHAGGQGNMNSEYRTLVGALVNKKALCAGYVRAFNYLCRTHGISYAYKNLSGTEEHAVAMAVYNNTWYNFDPTYYKRSERQMITDKALKSLGYVNSDDSYSEMLKFPTCNGKPTKPSVVKTTTSTSNSSTSTSKPSTSTSTSTQTKPKSDTEEEVFTDYHYKDFDNFSFIVKNHISYARNDGYTYYKITVPDGKLDLTIKYLKQMKADGTITYTSLAKGKTYVKITL